jgi:hypothetical protein
MSLAFISNHLRLTTRDELVMNAKLLTGQYGSSFSAMLDRSDRKTPYLSTDLQIGAVMHYLII